MPDACGREPQRGGGVARAARHPGRDRDPLDDRQPLRRRRPSPVAARNSVSARSARFSPLDAGADDRRRARRRARASPRRRGAVGWTSETSGCRPSARGAPTSRQRLTLPGACSAQALPQRAPSAGRATRRARRRGGRAPPARRGCGRGCPGAAPGASESERASALRRCAKPCWTSVRRLSGGAGAVAAQADEHGVDVRHRVKDAARDLARRRARRTRAGRARTGRRRRSVHGPAAKRSPTSFCTIATHVSHALELDRAQDHGRGDAVGQVGDDLVGAGSSARGRA